MCALVFDSGETCIGSTIKRQKGRLISPTLLLLSHACFRPHAPYHTGLGASESPAECPPARRGPHWWEGEVGDRTRTHRLTRGCVWHLQGTRLELKAPRPSRARSRQTPRSSCCILDVSMAGGEGREEGKRGGGRESLGRTARARTVFLVVV